METLSCICGNTVNLHFESTRHRCPQRYTVTYQQTLMKSRQVSCSKFNGQGREREHLKEARTREQWLLPCSLVIFSTKTHMILQNFLQFDAIVASDCVTSVNDRYFRHSGMALTTVSLSHTHSRVWTTFCFRTCTLTLACPIYYSSCF